MTVLPSYSDMHIHEMAPDEALSSWIGSPDAQKVKNFVNYLTRGSSIDPDDLWQDLIVKLLTIFRDGKYDANISKVSTFAERIAENRFKDLLRKRDSKIKLLTEIDQSGRDDPVELLPHQAFTCGQGLHSKSPETLLVELSQEEIDKQLLQEILAALAPKEVELLHERYVDEVPTNESAARRNKKPAAYRKQLSRIKAKAKKLAKKK